MCNPSHVFNVPRGLSPMMTPGEDRCLLTGEAKSELTEIPRPGHSQESNQAYSSAIQGVGRGGKPGACSRQKCRCKNRYIMGRGNSEDS